MSTQGLTDEALEMFAMWREACDIDSMSEVARTINAWAHRKGHYEDPHTIGEQIALIHSEVSEALEEYRKTPNDLTRVYYRPSAPGKPEGFGVEMADTIIRILDTCCELGIDIGKMVALKMAYNETRPHRHGKAAL